MEVAMFDEDLMVRHIVRFSQRMRCCHYADTATTSLLRGLKKAPADFALRNQLVQPD
jgi:hypothetical protein